MSTEETLDLIAQVESITDPVADDTDDPEFDDLYEGTDDDGEPVAS